ncbi:hypothetical protein [Spiroplasma endosymbiont of Lariophagus distinguendus]|uniref:hypothetical protein n=1 Tax=Spiroplasma endosymbiont of Lariophagus distinguendus TaxID=2935082 RepID=UPI00207A2D8A|nr:hypothetical protein [Spiroplasma endosymbiont of Lariophagus distinguendus]
MIKNKISMSEGNSCDNGTTESWFGTMKQILYQIPRKIELLNEYKTTYLNIFTYNHRPQIN